MGTPELNPELVATAAIWAGLALVVLLSTWLVVRSAIRSELRAERRREASSARTETRGLRSGSEQPSDVTHPNPERPGGEAASPTLAKPPLLAATPPNPYASSAPIYAVSLSQLPPPFVDAAVYVGPGAAPHVMSERSSVAPGPVATTAAPAVGVSAYSHAPHPTPDPRAPGVHPTPVAPHVIEPSAARHALEQLIADAPSASDDGSPDPGPRRRGRHA